MGVAHAIVKCEGQTDIYSPRQVFFKPVKVGQTLVFPEDGFETKLLVILPDEPYIFLDMGFHSLERRARLLANGWSIERPTKLKSAA